MYYVWGIVVADKDQSLHCIFKADSRFARSQWETVLYGNDVSH